MKLVSAKNLAALAVAEAGDDSSMFEVAPVSLWLEDYSALKTLFDQWRGAGVADLRGYLAADRGRIEACVNCMRIVRVNRRTLTLFEVDDLPHLVANLGAIFRDEMFVNLIDELVQLWNGRGEFVSNGVNYSLSGRRIDIQLKGAVLPGYEANWARVLIAARRRQRAGKRAALADAQRGLCARPLRTFADFAMGGGFQSRQASDG